MAWTFSNFALVGISQPEWRIKPDGPNSQMSLVLYSKTSSGELKASMAAGNVSHQAHAVP